MYLQSTGTVLRRLKDSDGGGPPCQTNSILAPSITTCVATSCDTPRDRQGRLTTAIALADKTSNVYPEYQPSDARFPYYL